MGQDLSKQMKKTVLEAGSDWKPRVLDLFDKFRGKNELIEGDRLLLFWEAYGKCVKLEFSAATIRDTYMKEADLDSDGKLSKDEMERFLRSKFKEFEKQK